MDAGVGTRIGAKSAKNTKRGERGAGKGAGKTGEKAGEKVGEVAVGRGAFGRTGLSKEQVRAIVGARQLAQALCE